MTVTVATIVDMTEATRDTSMTGTLPTTWTEGVIAMATTEAPHHPSLLQGVHLITAKTSTTADIEILTTGAGQVEEEPAAGAEWVEQEGAVLRDTIWEVQVEVEEEVITEGACNRKGGKMQQFLKALIKAKYTYKKALYTTYIIHGRFNIYICIYVMHRTLCWMLANSLAQASKRVLSTFISLIVSTADLPTN